jgi:hypothetical protein
MTRLKSAINLLLARGYYPVHEDCAGADAQRIDGQWYAPRWGRDTMQHVIDEHGDEGPDLEDVMHDAVCRALDEAGVRNQMLRGMCIEVAMEKAADLLEAKTGEATHG